MSNDGIKKILIVKLSAIGDIVQALPALPLLRKKFPAAYIGWVVEEKGRDILQGNRDIDEIITIDTKRWRKGLLSLKDFYNTAREIISKVKTIRAKRYDAAIDMQGLVKSGVITFISGADNRFGFNKRDCREVWNILFTNRKAEFTGKERHVVTRNIAPLKLLGIDTDNGDKEFFIDIDSYSQGKADLFFRDNLFVNERLIGINPGGGWETKLWSSERYARLADMLSLYYGAKVIILWGTDTERHTAYIISEMMKAKSVVSYKATIKELCPILKRCCFIVGGDTGPIHIADALGVATVTLYGPSSPVLSGPYKNSAAHIIGRCEELGCYKRRCDNFICMDSITVEEVFEKITFSLPKDRF